MGLFNKKENEKEKAPAPPKNSQSGNMGNSPLPPPPSSAPAPAPPKKEETTQNSNSFGGMPEPPSPVGGLDDIKNQISNKESYPSQKQEARTPAPNTQQDDESDFDSLFDLSELNEQIPKDMGNENNSHEEKSQQLELPEHRIHADDEELTFLKTQDESPRKLSNQSIYITTSQFKALLEIVEEVKLKAKDSAERHLRLLDIKSEEDIEFENLKKDFAFIEDKLYEVDNLIFEK